MIFYAAAALFLATFVLVQFGVLHSKPLRWMHLAVFVSGALALLALNLYATGCVSLL